jgi:hypothetical protein
LPRSEVGIMTNSNGDEKSLGRVCVHTCSRLICVGSCTSW